MDNMMFQFFYRWFVRLNHESQMLFEQCKMRIRRKARNNKNFFIWQIELNECYLGYVARKRELLNALADLGYKEGWKLKKLRILKLKTRHD